MTDQAKGTESKLHKIQIELLVWENFRKQRKKIRRCGCVVAFIVLINIANWWYELLRIRGCVTYVVTPTPQMWCM